MKNRNLDHKDHWQTPPEFKAKLNKKYNFDFDPCPLEAYFDGLIIPWGKSNFVNPPYSQNLKDKFVHKALKESKKGKLCVMLLPVSTSTILFKDVIEPNITKPVHFEKGRLPFIGINSKGQCVNYHLIQEVPDFSIIKHEGKLIPKYIKGAGQHDSMIVIFDGRSIFIRLFKFILNTFTRIFGLIKN